ncbi:YlxR family protein [Brachybacterium huguangmaarense]
MDPRTATSTPERTCVGCRKKAARDQLVRLVREGSPTGGAPVVRVDARASAPGRGAWLHPDARCLDLAIARGGLARSFRGPVDTSALEGLADALEADHRFIHRRSG